MAGNHKEEFGLLWDYAHELRSKMLGNTIKIVVQKARFLSLLLTDLGLEVGYEYTIISYQQKGLEIAISDILPRVEYRNCIVKCTNEKELEDLCSTLEKKDKDAYDNLMKKSPNMWARAFLGTTCILDIVDNNLCAAFNSSIVEASPLVKAKFDANKKDCIEWQLIWNGENGYKLRKR
ncbi:hypothetical protein Golob_021738, partial [Gossypium lobatum]|nr:hypothetical protein [Gossypium lobatum]